MRTSLLLVLILMSGLGDRESRRFTYAREQGRDDSCGLQALACFLELYWGMPAGEDELYADLVSALAARGGGARDPGLRSVSLGELRLILEGRGFFAEAYRMGFEGLLKAGAAYAPLIIHYDRPQGHFVVLVAALADGVVVADPSSGLLFLPRRDFEARWSGAVLLARLPGREPDGRIMDSAVAAALGPAALLREAAALARRLRL